MADSDIKTAAEIAKEKIEKLGDPTPEERLKWKYGPLGEQLAGKYLKEEVNLVAELAKLSNDAKKYVAASAASVLVRNLTLPKTDIAKNTNRKAMDGLKILKNDKTKVENVFSQMRHLFTHYGAQGEQQRKQAYQSVKAEFEARLQQAMQQQGIAPGTRVNVEQQPQFQQEWRKVQAQLDGQYLNLLSEYKKELESLN